MSKLYATITSDRSSTSRTSSHGISTTAETWHARIVVDLLESGNCIVELTDKNGSNRRTLWEGNADETAEKSTA